jgi:hypothetical protein
MQSLTPDHDERVRRIALGDVAVIQALPDEKQAMEMAAYGKHGKL